MITREEIDDLKRNSEAYEGDILRLLPYAHWHYIILDLIELALRGLDADDASKCCACGADTWRVCPECGP